MLNPQGCRRLIVYGGTFDPPHKAHARLPFHVADRLDADGVLFVPAGEPPHKADDDRTPAHDRLAMLRLAVGDRDDAAICTYEIEHAGPSYTWKTLEHLRQKLGDAVDLRLLMGMDMAMIFHRWERPERVVELADPLVLLRPPHDRPAFFAELPPRWRDFWASRIVEAPELDVASSELRAALVSGDRATAERWLAPAVLGYIATHGLYAR